MAFVYLRRLFLVVLVVVPTVLALTLFWNKNLNPLSEVKSGPQLRGLDSSQAEILSRNSNSFSQVGLKSSSSPVSSGPPVLGDLPDPGPTQEVEPKSFPAPPTVPMPDVTLPADKLIEQRWAKELKTYLKDIPPHSAKKSLISVVSCDVNFKGMLLNWLTTSLLSCQPPLSDNIILLTLDLPLYELMTQHGFKSLFAEGKEIIKDASKLKYVQTHSRTPKLPLVMSWRLVIIRLLNHWGYDVANYDTDAMVFKNTENLFYGNFSSSDFIGSRANFPSGTSRKYGLTMCGGLFMVKSSPGTGKYTV